MKYYYILLLMLLDAMLLMFLPTFGMGHEKPEKGKITINLYIKNVKSTDTIFFQMKNPANSTVPLNTVAKVMEGGSYRFEVPVSEKNGYWMLLKKATFTDKGRGSGMNSITHFMHWVAGDSINIHMTYKESSTGVLSKFYFNGRGSLKYTLQNKIDSIFGNADIPVPDCSDKSALFENPARETISFIKALLNRHKDNLTDLEYGVLEAQAVYANSSVFYFINKCYGKNPDSISQINFISYYKKNLKKLIPRNLPDSVLSSSQFIDFMFYKYYWETRMLKGRDDLRWMYESIKANESGFVRDRLIAKTFIECKKTIDFGNILEDANRIVKDKYTKMVFSSFRTCARGKELKHFVMTDTGDKQIKLSDFQGKVVFLDVWSSGCGACHAFYKDTLSKVKASFHNDSSVAFISIGVDRRKERWLADIESNMYTSKDAINLNTGNRGTAHPGLIENGIIATPTAILVDKAGHIVKFNTEDLYTENGLTAAINSLK